MSVEQVLKDQLSAFGVENIQDTTLLTEKLDSMEMLELMLCVEESFDIIIEDSDIESITTFKDLVQAVTSRKPE